MKSLKEVLIEKPVDASGEQLNGNYPGVSSIRLRDWYKENCPDPNVILRIRGA